MSTTKETTTPTVWALLGRRAGDNAQILALAEGLGFRLERKQLRFNRRSALPNVLLGASLLSLAPESRDLLQPPWPDAIVTAGRRGVPAARWIRGQSRGAVRLIHVGRPWGPTSWYDLIVTTPQYRLRAAPNIIHNLMPLYRPPAADAPQIEYWTERFSHLPRPWIGVLVGGSSRPQRLDAPAARQLAAMVDSFAVKAGGSLLVTFGGRASQAASEAFSRAVTARAYIHVMQSHGKTAERNPYRALLHLADRLVVTSDSASMLAEAAQTGKKVDVFSIPKRMDFRSAVGQRVFRQSEREGGFARFCRTLLDYGLVTSVRDLDRYQAELHRAGMLEAGDAAARRQSEELARAVARARALVASSDGQPP